MGDSEHVDRALEAARKLHNAFNVDAEVAGSELIITDVDVESILEQLGGDDFAVIGGKARAAFRLVAEHFENVIRREEDRGVNIETAGLRVAIARLKREGRRVDPETLQPIR